MIAPTCIACDEEREDAPCIDTHKRSHDQFFERTATVSIVICKRCLQEADRVNALTVIAAILERV